MRARGGERSRIVVVRRRRLLRLAKKAKQRGDVEKKNEDDGLNSQRATSSLLECAPARGRTLVATPRERLARAKAILEGGENELGGGTAGGSGFRFVKECGQSFREIEKSLSGSSNADLKAFVFSSSLSFLSFPIASSF